MSGSRLRRGCVPSKEDARQERSYCGVLDDRSVRRGFFFSTVESCPRSNRVDGEHGGFSCQLDLAHRTVSFDLGWVE